METLRSRVTALAERLPLTAELVRIYARSEVHVYAGYATLRIVMAFFPLFMLIIAVANLLPGYSPEAFSETINSLLPDIPEVKNMIAESMSNLQAQSSGVLASVAALTTLWSASKGVTAIQKGLRKVNGDDRKGARNKFRALAFTVVLIVLIPAVTLFNLLGSSLAASADRIAGSLGLEPYAVDIANFLEVSGLLTAGISFLMILMIYDWLPGGRRRMKDQIPGTVFTAVCWSLFTKLFSIFIPVFWKSTIYGSLASFFLTILWLQTMIQILLLGSAVNRAAAVRRQTKSCLNAPDNPEPEAAGGDPAESEERSERDPSVCQERSRSQHCQDE